ncbi:anti-sigma factor [Paracidobacterium acidisoli]|uniref:Regulator of SigK n=1 Tax=Paracidobacterium acidisoli TaxID=2303751 RepID=A0A372ITQ3_9BACT|nr:anti-sigma factor [Paracidobacterium acidisoli]MBT9330737.1 anti-sigma factor [Paracidobacterium acidisoli]
MSAQHIPEDDLTLYAMQALAPDEMREVQTHLDQCAQCRDALASALGDMALLALSVEEQPLPAGARERFLSRIDEAPAGIAVVEAPRHETPRSEYPEESFRRGRTGIFGWLGWVAAAACLAGAVFLYNGNTRLQRELSQTEYQNAQYQAGMQRAQDLMDLLTAPQASQVTLTETKQIPHPSGHAIYLPKKGALIFVASNLNPLPPNKTYELWLIPASGKAPVPAGLFRPDTSGAASIVLPPLPSGVAAKAFGVTIEDLQGSQTPTLPIIMSGE